MALSSILPQVDYIHLILSWQGQMMFRPYLLNDKARNRISVSIQKEPRGMGDTIFCGKEFWSESDNIFIVWGDQLHISEDTIHRTPEAHNKRTNPCCTLPIVEVDNPYVQYMLESSGRLKKIRQRREGDHCDIRGYSDVGAFALSVNGLNELWNEYIKKDVRGAKTNEINFLPFLEFLSTVPDYTFQTIIIKDPLKTLLSVVVLIHLLIWNFIENFIADIAEYLPHFKFEKSSI